MRFSVLLFVCLFGKGFSFCVVRFTSLLLLVGFPSELNWAGPGVGVWWASFLSFPDLYFFLLFCFLVKRVHIMEVSNAWLLTWNVVLDSFTGSHISWEPFHFAFPLFLLSIFALLCFFETGFETCFG